MGNNGKTGAGRAGAALGRPPGILVFGGGAGQEVAGVLEVQQGAVQESNELVNGKAEPVRRFPTWVFR